MIKPKSPARVVLTVLEVKPILRRKMVTIARNIAGTEHAGDVTLLRLQERGLVECVYQITEAGRQELRGCAG